MTGVSADHGVFNDPESFYATIRTNLTGVRRVAYRLVVRRWMNRNARTMSSRSRTRQ